MNNHEPPMKMRSEHRLPGSKRPEYSSHWVTRLAIGAATLTGIAGGPPWARAADVRARKAKPARASKRRRTGNTNSPRGASAARQMWLRCELVSIGK